jgi:hypothetical protein
MITSFIIPAAVVVGKIVIDTRDLDQLKDLGAGQPAPEAVVRLYRRAFTDFGTRALWNWRDIEHPTITQALAIAGSLKAEGNLEVRALAVEIEQACGAAL